jgi:thimet oligopeptidase
MGRGPIRNDEDISAEGWGEEGFPVPLDPRSPETAAPALGPALPFPTTEPEVRRRTERAIREGERQLAALLAKGGPRTVENFLEPIERILLEVRGVGDQGEVLFAVHPDAPLRAAGREAAEAADRLFNSFYLNPEAYRALGEIDLARCDSPTRFAVERMRRDMRRSGVEQAPEARSRLLALANEIDRVCNTYFENTSRAVRSIEVGGAEELPGLPADYLAAHPPDARGRIRVTTQYPDALPVLTYCERADVRRRMLFEVMNRAYPENLPVLVDMLGRRDEFARALGYRRWSDYAFEDKMSGRPEVVRAFLAEVAGLLRGPAARERDWVLARKRREEPGAEKLEPWDTRFFGEGFYDTRLRTEEFGLDLKQLRRYLPYPQVRDGLFALCEELLGLSIARVEGAEVWHPTVEAYDARTKDGPLGRFYLDLVPREGKYDHAAHFTILRGIRGVQLPTSALVCNFLDPSKPPAASRMEYASVVTFFHEFGHLLHALFSGHGPRFYTTMHQVERDFIEAPSLLFEEWARDAPTVLRFARDPDTGERPPPELLAQLRAGIAFGRASSWMRQLGLSAVSLEYYDRDPTGIDTGAVFREVFERYDPLAILPEYHMEANWTHLAGYSAAYYTYVWSAVIARDLLRPFYEKGSLTDPEIAARYVREILTPGSTRPAAELVRRYLGREFDLRAFADWVREAPMPPDSVPAGSKPAG